MTRTTNARLAGFEYLFYIAVTIPGVVLFSRATSGKGIAAKLASVAQHASDVRMAVVLELLGCFSALVLAVTLYGITRDEDPELSMMALACRVAEGVLGAASLSKMLEVLWLASAGAGAGATDPAAVNALGAFLLMPDSVIVAIFFAVGSTIFCWLLLRGRMVPVALARLGVLTSVLLVVGLPLQLAGFLKGSMTSFMVMWMPMLVFEVVLALWLLIKGVAAQPARMSPLQTEERA